MNDYSPFPNSNNSSSNPQQTYPFNNGTTLNHNTTNTSTTNTSSHNSTSTLSINESDDENKTDTNQSQSSINNKLQQLDINTISPTNTNINTNTNSTTNNNPNTQFINSNTNTTHTLISLISNPTNNNAILFTNNNSNESNDLSLTQTTSPSTPRNSIPGLPSNSINKTNTSKSQPILLTNTPNNPLLTISNNSSTQSLTDANKFEPPSICTNDPGAPIISLDKAKREFKTVSQAAFRFQFICDAYRKCKLGTVKEKDFSKLEDVINYVHDQLIKRRHRNSQNNVINSMMPSKSPIPPSNYTNYSSDDIKNETIRPILCNVSSPVCSICNKSFPSNHCYTTCNHPLCIKCLVNTFNQNPKNPRWYMCTVNGCRSMLPPEAHFLVLSYKPKPPNTSSQLSETKTKQLYKKMVSQYIRVRNISYKNMLKIVGEYFSSKLQYYDRWRKCENCDFGFLADPDVSWYQVFELKCVVCNVIQRVQLLGPNPCVKLSIRSTYYPNDAITKTLIFVRHGEAQNNITPNDPNLRDPNLTMRGKEQCKHLKKYFGTIVNVDCILCSVMNRCIQTAIIGIYKKEYKNKIPFIVLENLRERLCPMFNRRENISVKKEKYKGFGIDFSECKCDEDLYFDKEKKNEKYEHMNKRAWQFYKYLMTRKEQTIAIVSHEGMLQCLTNIINSNDKCLRKSFKNAGARMCFLTHRK